MHTPKPVLVLIRYNKKARLSPEGFLPITSVTEVAPELCRPSCELEGADEEREEWKIYTHLRAEGKAGIHLALKLEPPEYAKSYRVTISPTRHGGEQELRRYPDTPGPDDKQVYFIIPARFRKEDENLLILPGPSGNIASAGQQFIHIHGPTNRSVRLRVCPSGFSEEEYRLILQDLALIHRQLLMGQGKAQAVTVGQREAFWKAKALDVERQAAQMRAILRRLEAAPERELIAAQSRLPSYKLKKLSPKTLMDQAAGKRLLRAGIHEESFQIYEHRMIRTYLENLKRLAGQYRALEKRERRALAGEPIGETERQTARAQLSRAVRELFLTPKAPSAYPNIRLPIRIYGEPQLQKKGSYEYGELFVTCLLGDAQPILACDAAFLRFPNCLLAQLGMKLWHNGRQALFFRQCVEKLQQRWGRGTGPFEAVFTGRFSLSYTQQLTRCRVEIQELTAMEIPGQGALRLQDLFSGRETQEDWMRHIWDNLDQAIPDGSDELFHHITLLRRADFQRELLAREDSRWDALERQLDQLLKTSPLLRGAGTGERLHTSNLFAKHRYYRRAYRLMRETQPQFAGIELWEGEPLPVDETNKIYELWCLFKMLSIWICDYAFTLHSPTIEALTGQVLRHLRCEAYNVDTIVLKKEGNHLAGMELRLDYDRPRPFREDGRETYLRPDYFLTVRYGGETYRFCMDAKYRNYDPEQMTKEAWYEDILEVALDKYLFRLRQSLDAGEELDGSYILHSDAGSRGAGGQDVGRYFWSKIAISSEDPDAGPEEKEGIKRYLARKGRGRREAEILSRLPGELREVRDCQFGSVCFTPLSDRLPDAAFRGLMQMIMEHFLGLYRAKCWMCGSEDLEVQKLLTGANFTKYHIICKNCKEFWVESHCLNSQCNRKLGKHSHNYYRVKTGRLWNIICPDCGARF